MVIFMNLLDNIMTNLMFILKLQALYLCNFVRGIMVVLLEIKWNCWF